MHPDRIAVRVPASTANLGPGFDTIGMALNLYADIEMKRSDRTRIRLSGENLEGIPADESNLVFKVARQVMEEAGAEPSGLDIAMRSDIPLTRGLGSSASAIVGAMAAANALIGSPFSDDDLFQMAVRLEDHPDNVGASLFGGIIVANWDGNRAEHIRIEPDPRLEVAALVPDFHLETKKARHVLPENVPHRDAVYNVSHASLLVAALSAGRLDMIRHAMKDRLHQPYRSRLIPGMREILDKATEFGALGVALSGAGPTLLALVDGERAERHKLEAFLRDTMERENVPSRLLWLRPSAAGVQVLTAEDGHSTFIEDVEVK